MKKGDKVRIMKTTESPYGGRKGEITSTIVLIADSNTWHYVDLTDANGIRIAVPFREKDMEVI